VIEAAFNADLKDRLARFVIANEKLDALAMEKEARRDAERSGKREIAVDGDVATQRAATALKKPSVVEEAQRPRQGEQNSDLGLHQDCNSKTSRCDQPLQPVFHAEPGKG
jgi:SAM-dependent MidA family methyltransferase